VQIYEPILGDRAGLPQPACSARRNTSRTNRLLPRGFDKATAAGEIGVYGEAARDADFTGGGDHVRYAVPVPGQGPFTVEVEAALQTIGFPWAHNLDGYDAPDRSGSCPTTPPCHQVRRSWLPLRRRDSAPRRSPEPSI